MTKEQIAILSRSRLLEMSQLAEVEYYRRSGYPHVPPEGSYTIRGDSAILADCPPREGASGTRGRASSTPKTGA